jgi:hypothetical protein
MAAADRVKFPWVRGHTFWRFLMANRLLTERVADLRTFGRVKAAGLKLPYAPQGLAHVYVKLDLKPQYENASTADDARGFLRSVARAAMAAQRIAERYDGVLLEVQGSTLHVGLSRRPGATEMDSANAYVADLHWAYRDVFNDSRSRVEGWRMTVDSGKTLLVAGRGPHGDDSWVSLGKAANRPAKHLYAQLELAEEDRELRRFFAGIRNPVTGEWHHERLDRTKSRLEEVKSIANEARQAEPKLDFLEAVPQWKLATARALPLAPAGTPASPSPEKPHTYFGWVMRVDLDGFTARVEECFDNDQRLHELADEFYRIMEAAAQFTVLHKETLAQLPWAGDNFTAAAVFAARADYDRAIPRRLVELSLDFEKEMAEAAIDCGFGGWAHGIAGGDVHGNSAGNVYLAGVEVGQRRFLVGAGEGFGRSAQAFGDINPKAKEVVVFKPDWERLDEAYKKAFEPAVTQRGQESTLYRVAKVDVLIRARARQASVGAATTITFPGGQSRPVPSKPHWK